MRYSILVNRRTACAQLAALFSSPWFAAGSLRSAAAGSPAPSALGSETQLFVDDRIVAERENLERVLRPAVKANDGQPIRFWQRDAQGNRVPMPTSIYASPVYDAERGVFRIWSRVYPGLTKSRDLPGTEIHKHMRYGYSESQDGIDFDFISELSGLHSLGDYNSVVTLDEHESDPDHRYKIGYDGSQTGVNGACLAHSADGIHWTPYNEGKPVTHRAADFTNCLVWDESRQSYLLFTRTDYGTGGGEGEIRGMRVMSNPDVKANPTAWTTLREWKLDREGPEEFRRRQIYSMTDWQRHGVHFGLFAVYEWPNDFSEGRDTNHRHRHERDIINYYLATSRDGIEWNLDSIYAGQPLVERGGDTAWDKDLILPANWIATRGDEHWIYYGGADERHGTGGVFEPRRNWGIGLAKAPLDRFVSLSAGNQPGSLVTIPFTFDGDALEVNVDAQSGEIAIDLLDESSKPIAGFSGPDAAQAKQIDELRWQPRWKQAANDVALNGQPVRLQFRLRNADLFSFRVLRNA